jgi:hypothetical protein
LKISRDVLRVGRIVTVSAYALEVAVGVHSVAVFIGSFVFV